jgi:hypothetical protein
LVAIGYRPHCLTDPRRKRPSAAGFPKTSEKRMQQMCQKITKSRLFDEVNGIVAIDVQRHERTGYTAVVVLWRGLNN